MSVASPSPSVTAFAMPWAREIPVLFQGDPEGNPCGLMPDVDESAHAGYALAKNAGTGMLHDQANQQINLSTSHRLIAALAFEPLVTGASGMAGLLISSAIVTPLALMAMYAGFKEWRGTSEKAKDFAEAGRILEAERSFSLTLTQTSKGLPPHEIAAFQKATETRLVDHAKTAATVRFGGLIGRYSFLSGVAILGRIGFELLRNIAGDSNPTFLNATGIAANACGCLAAGFAFMLGYHFVRKSGAFYKKWQADAAHIATKLSRLADPNSAYGRFLQAKSAHRAAFAKSFCYKNRFFMAGAGLYAAGTMLPSCVKMLAAVGALSSKKVGADLILALFATAMAGALVMGIFSHQFFTGHPKLERYEEQRFKEPKELDARFLKNIDSVERGLALREAAFDALRRCETLRCDLVADIARATQRTHQAPTYVGDLNYKRVPTLAALRQRFDSNRLKIEHVEAWLEAPASRRRVLAAFAEIIAVKLRYLEEKTKMHKVMHDRVLGTLVNDHHATSQALFNERKAFAERAFGSYDAAVALLYEHRALAAKLTSAEVNAVFDRAMRDLLALHMPEPDDDAERALHAKPTPHRVASYLLEYLPQRFSHDRGILLETEAEAGKHHTPMHAASR